MGANSEAETGAYPAPATLIETGYTARLSVILPTQGVDSYWEAHLNQATQLNYSMFRNKLIYEKRKIYFLEHCVNWYDASVTHRHDFAFVCFFTLFDSFKNKNYATFRIYY